MPAPIADTLPADALAAPCARCHQAAAWLISPVREHQQVMAVEAQLVTGDFLGESRYQGQYTALICAGCGDTGLWAYGYAPARAPVAHRACSDCGDTRAWIIAEAPDRDERRPTRLRVRLAPRWFGTLGVAICAGCGRASWSCAPDDVFVEERDGGTASPRPCRHCGEPRLRGPLYDQYLDDHYPRTVAPSYAVGLDGARGRFVADTCLGCREVEWVATGLEELDDDAAVGVQRVSAPCRRAAGPTAESLWLRGRAWPPG